MTDFATHEQKFPVVGTTAFVWGLARKRQTAMEVLHRAFIFEKELKVLLLKAEQEHQGALYGLWTTDGEPVIHIKQLFKDWQT